MTAVSGMGTPPKIGSSADHAPDTTRWPAVGRLWLVAFVFGILIFLFSLALDWILLHDHQTVMAVIVSDGLGGIVAGVLAWKVLQFERERRRRIEERLVTISEMNHHIRNALQVISFSVHSSGDQKRLAEITESMDRIQWALREVLPKVEPTFEPFEGSARERFPDIRRADQKPK